MSWADHIREYAQPLIQIQTRAMNHLTKKEEDAVTCFKARITKWKCPSRGDRNLAMLFSNDRKDMRRVLSCFIQGKYKEACEIAGHMDTICRDEIPQAIWDRIHED